jgi:hypothetical protein
VSCQAASPDKERWVPRPIALASQHAQEVERHAPPLVAGVEALPPEPDAARPQGGGTEGTTAMEPLGGVGGTACEEDVGEVRVPLLTRPSVLCVVSPCVGSLRVEGGANGRATMPCRLDQVPRGVNNLGEALAAICSLASFPPMPGAPAYKPWEACL